MWWINGSYVDTKDSIVFTPTSIGSFAIDATWNGNISTVTLQLHSAPPPHAVFTVTGGTINTAHDTIWMCGTSVNVFSNTLGSDATSYGWYGPMSPNVWNDPIQLSTPGTYHFDRPNSCGMTSDTFVLVQLPPVLPSFGPADTSFCNTPVSLDLDAGPGWTYNWNTGVHTQTLHIDTAGTYTVNLTNMCTNGSVTIHVHHQTFPLPDLFYQMGSFPFCADSVVVLDPSPGYLYDSYHWSNGTTLPTLSISGITTGGGLHQVTVSQGTCSAEAYGIFNFLQVPVKPEICIVTVDNSVNKNQVVWTTQHEPTTGSTTYAQTAGYNIYKWGGGTTYTFLGFVPVTQIHVFTDLTSNPPMVSARYKITAVDACGIESTMSFYQQTILLSVMQGQNPGEVPLIWTPYYDESGMFVVDQYQIYRGNHPDSLVFYDQTPFTSYNDIGVIGQKYYKIVVTKVGGCDPSPAKTIIAGSSSNIINNTNTSINEQSSSGVSLSIYPNPSTGIFNIEAKNINLIEVLDNLGRTVITTNNPTIDMSKQSSGIYNARVYTKAGVGNCKLVVE